MAQRPQEDKESHGVRLSEWLRLMLAEITRKREELERARAEQARRELEYAAEPRRADRA